MKSIAVLITSYNRKDKTVKCLRALFRALNSQSINIEVFLTDDNSTDNTKGEVNKQFPEVNILSGTGFLYWAGGMRLAWEKAKRDDFDGFLLLNDDTYVSDNVFEELLSCHKYAIEELGHKGIYIGSTHDGNMNFSYGGSIMKNSIFNTSKILKPNGKIQHCERGNANIMLVSKDVVEKIGILSADYQHSVADYDYTLKASRSNIPVLTTANYCGTAQRNKDKYQSFLNLSYQERLKMLNSPTGFCFRDQVTYMKRFYPLRVPLLYLGALLKIVFPSVYILSYKFRRLSKF